MALVGYTITVVAKQDNPYNVLPETDISIRKNSDNTLVNIYADEDGLIPIAQLGAKTDSNGQFTFYADASLGVLKAVWTNGGVIATEVLDQNDHSKLVNRNAAGAHDAIAIATSEGGSVQDFITELSESESRMSGFDIVGSFKSGFTVEFAYQSVVNDDGKIYQWRGALPKVSTGTTLASNGGVGASLWLEIKNHKKVKSCADLKNTLADGGTFKISCWGDSTWWGSVSNNAGVQEVKNPSVILDETLYAVYRGNNPTIENKAIPGTNLDSMIRGTHLYANTFDYEMSISDATLIMSNHAQNDCNSYAHTVDEFKANLILFVSIVRKYNKVPMLITPNTTFTAAAITENANRRLPAFVDAIREVARDMNVDLVDNYYYFTKTARSVAMSELVPDGVHPSAKAYGITGRCAAIPLVAAGSLSNVGDGFGLSNVSYKDTVTNTRVLAPSVNQFGNTLSYQSDATAQMIQVPVILDNPTDDNVLAISCLAWNDGGRVGTVHNGTLSSDSFSGEIDQLDNAVTDYNYLASPSICDMYAGLHVVGIFTGAGQVSGANGASISGLKLIKRAEYVSSLAFRDGLETITRPIMSGDRVSFAIDIDVSQASATHFNLTSILANNAPWLIIKSELDVLSISLNSVNTVIASGFFSGVYDCEVFITHNRTVTVKFGGITVTTPAMLRTAPRSYISLSAALPVTARVYRNPN